MQVAEANSEAAKYSSGILYMEAQLRVAILKNVVTMLEQKRESLVRGLVIVYRDPLIRAPNQDTGSEAELTKAESEAHEAHQEADQYTQGLIRSMALVREVTAKATAASIEQRIELARTGIPLPETGSASTITGLPPGKPSSDKDAL